MNIGDMLLKAGETALSVAFPGVAGPAISLINGLLPDGKKLPENVTGTQAKTVMDTLSPEHQAVIMGKQIDLQIAESNNWASIQESLSKADEAGASTRPKIANRMSIMIVLFTLFCMIMMTIIVYKKDADMLKIFVQLWPMALTMIGTPTLLLRSYFGMRTKEKQSRYHLATGQQPPANGLSSLIGLFK